MWALCMLDARCQPGNSEILPGRWYTNMTEPLLHRCKQQRPPCSLKTMLVVQSGGFLSRFHSTEVCKTSPTSAQHGHGRLVLTQARETHLPAALDLSEGWMRLWWGPRDGDAHMHTCAHAHTSASLCFQCGHQAAFSCLDINTNWHGKQPWSQRSNRHSPVPSESHQLLQAFFLHRMGELDFRMHKAPLAHLLNKLLPCSETGGKDSAAAPEAAKF